MSTSQHVVICYSREDTDFMERIRNNLRHVGLQIWTDEAYEPGSEEWKTATVKAVRNAGVVLVLMSPSSNRSELVKRVIQLAQNQKVEVLPLMIKGQVHQSLLPILADMEYIDLRDDYEGNIIQVIRLCYEYRQQDDVRTTAELRQAMVDDNNTSVEAPKTAKPEVKVSVRQLKSMDEIRKHDDPPPPNRMRVILGGVLIVVGLVAGIFALLFFMGLPPFSSAEGTDEVIVEASEEVTVEVTAEASAESVEATQEITPTETVLPPTATDVPATATTRPPSTPTDTDEPPTATPIPSTATPVPPTSTPTFPPPTIAVRTVAPQIQATATSAPPTNAPPTSAPTQVQATVASASDGNLEMLYNGDTFVLHNTGDENINLTGMQFILLGESDTDSVLFIAEEWAIPDNILHPERCVQVWRVEFAELPANEPPADVCAARSGFRSTPRRFWIADGDKTIFEVRQRNNVLVQCNAAMLDSNRILTCRTDV